MTHQHMPLAEQLRPNGLDSVIGQDVIAEQGWSTHPDRPITSAILWGPPGCGKTTIARILGQRPGYHYITMSSTSSGIPDLRKAIIAAKASELPTILFVDEIHRWSKPQQDALLPHIEDGTVILIGATTENPSFSLTKAMLSRAPVVILQPLDATAMGNIFDRAVAQQQRSEQWNDDAKAWAIRWANGDARALINLIERLEHDDAITVPLLEQRMAQFQAALTNDDHYDLLSAIHKSCRASDTDGALYWVARALTAGANPHTPPDAGLVREIFRRLTCVASEDIGMADPQALVQVRMAHDAYEFVGWPEGRIHLGQAICYVTTAPKSNRSYHAMNMALELAKQTSYLPVPNHATNAPTKLLESMGKHEGYIYDHDTERAFSGLPYLPPELQDQELYTPSPRGYEDVIGKRVNSWRQRRQRTKR